MTSQCAAGQVCDANDYMCRTCGDRRRVRRRLRRRITCAKAAPASPGQCRTSPECPNGQLCDVAHPHLRRRARRTPSAWPATASNHLCVSGGCVSGMCLSTADCGGGQICNTATRMCVGVQQRRRVRDGATGRSTCASATSCVAGQCRVSSDCPGGQICDAPTRTCNPCGSDTACSVDPSYGASTVCLGGRLHPRRLPRLVSADCPTGQLCGISAPNTCGGCSTDAQCTADPRYGAGHICFQGICQPGNCHGTSADCTGALAGYAVRRAEREHLRRVRDRLAVPGRFDLRLGDDLQHDHRPVRQRRVRQRDVHRQRSVRGQHRRLLLRRAVHARQLLRRRRLRAASGSFYRCVNNSCTGCSRRDRQQVLRRSGERQRRRARPAAAWSAASPTRAAASAP